MCSTASTRFPIESPLIGKINVYNILAACGAGLTLRIRAGDHRARHRAPARRSRAASSAWTRDSRSSVVVDYAHTDDALRNTISVARGLKPKRVITLFGCGGDRDRTKRPLMGQAAAELSDFVVLTSDNPRSEDPLAIMNDALVGSAARTCRTSSSPTATAAIRRAIKEARAGRHRDPRGQRPRDLPGSEGQDHPFRRPRSGARSAAGVWVSQDTR